MNKKLVSPNVVEYMVNKLAALGLLLFLMCSYLLLATEFDLYEFTENLSNLKIWGLICGYALVTTMLIDLIRYRWIAFTVQTGVLLHCLAGFIVFFPFMGISFFSVIAGAVSSLCAFIYAFSSYLFHRKKKFAWVILLVFPLLLSVRLYDFTSKKGWTVEETNSSFSAEFEHFNGKHEILLSLKKGEKVTSYLSFTQIDEGGYGYHILDHNEEYVGIKELEESEEEDTQAIEFNAAQPGVYKIIVTGDELKGKIDVNWEID